MSGAAVTKIPLGVPPLRDVQDAGSIRLHEIVTDISVQQLGSASGSRSSDKQAQNKWLALAAREVLGVCTTSSLYASSSHEYMRSGPQVHYWQTDN